MFKNRKGFTMIELVLVIVIIGILAAIAIPKYIDLASNAKVSATKGALGTIRAAVAMAYAKNMSAATLPATANQTSGFPTLQDIGTDNIANYFSSGTIPTNSNNGKNDIIAMSSGSSNTHGWQYDELTGNVKASDTNGWGSY